MIRPRITTRPRSEPTLDVIVPAFNAADTLRPCLHALFRAGAKHEDTYVVNDRSTDDTEAIATALGVRVVTPPHNLGAAAARNLGVAGGTGNVLVFVDADVCVAPDALNRIRQRFEDEPDLVAVFGSYDDEPAASGTVSRVRNLLHHYVHQMGAREATSFWTGLGAVRRDAFETVGGFAPDQRMMEDVRLGNALWREGYRIALDPTIQGKHLKHWSLLGMAKTDLLDRAIPWSQLLLGPAADVPAGLNVSREGKLSVTFTSLFALCATLAVLVVWTLPVLAMLLALCAASALAAMVWINRSFLQLVHRKLGTGASLKAIGVLAVHFLVSALGYAWVRLGLSRLNRKARSLPDRKRSQA